jgi:hypothetical protein
LAVDSQIVLEIQAELADAKLFRTKLKNISFETRKVGFENALKFFKVHHTKSKSLNSTKNS